MKMYAFQRNSVQLGSIFITLFLTPLAKLTRLFRRMNGRRRLNRKPLCISFVLLVGLVLYCSYLAGLLDPQNEVFFEEIIASTDIATSDLRAQTSLKLVSYNIWCNYFQPHTLRTIRDRMEGLVEGLRSFDVVLVQEIFILNAGFTEFTGCATDVVQLMEQYGFLYRTSINHFVPRLFGKNAGVVIFSKVPFTRTSYEQYGRSSWRDLHSHRGFVVVQVALNGKPVFVLTTHLDPHSPQIRDFQTRHLVSAIQNLPKHSHVVVGGDFNIDNYIPGPSVDENSSQYVDLVNNMARAGLRSVFDGRQPTCTDGGHYDMIFVSHNLSVNTKMILQLYSETDQPVSDHFGLAVELT